MLMLTRVPQTRSWGATVPAEFSSNPDQTHLPVRTTDPQDLD